MEYTGKSEIEQIADVMFFSITGGMVSAIGVVHSSVYTKYVGKTTTWYVAVGDNPADNVQCVGDREGYGGSEMTLKLDAGGEDKVIGLWDASAEALFHDTGVDVRHTKSMEYVIALHCEDIGLFDYKLTDVYCHKKGQGVFGEWRDRAKEIANKLGKKVYVCSRTSGGGSMSWALPDEKEGE